MQRLFNALKSQAAALDASVAQPRFGVVSSVDPSTYTARVLLQPEGVLSGWLPIAATWVGAGWGMVAPPSPGQQVVVLAQEGQAEHGIVVGGLFSLSAQPPPAPSGELWLVHQTGSFFKLHNDGSIEGKATVWNLTGLIQLTGSLVASGDVSDQGGAHGTLANLRTIYDEHVHPDVQNGPGSTGLPIPQA